MSAHDHRIPAAPIAGATAGASLLAYALPALAGVSRWNGAPLLPALRTCLGVEDATRDGAGYALTFDDGPHPQGTPAVLEVLARERTQATFFLVGEQVQRNPALAAEIVAAGHEIGLHCNRHRNLLRLTPAQVAEDIARAQAAIEAATGRSPRLYRPPYGVLNGAALLLARRRRWRTLLWSRWGRDWDERATPQSICARLTDRPAAGAVLLLHDADDYSAPGSHTRTVAALPRVIGLLAERGLRPTSA